MGAAAVIEFFTSADNRCFVRAELIAQVHQFDLEKDVWVVALLNGWTYQVTEEQALKVVKAFEAARCTPGDEWKDGR